MDLLVTRCIDGRTWQADDVPSEQPPRVAARLRCSTRCPCPTTCGGRLCAPGAAPRRHACRGRRWRRRLRARAAAGVRADPVRRLPLALCHNDLHHLNLIDDGPRLWLVDWEYGGRGNPLFDVAGFLALHDLGRSPTSVFLEAYGRLRAGDGGLLGTARWTFDYVQWLWYRLRFPDPVGDDAWYAERLAQRLLRCNN